MRNKNFAVVFIFLLTFMIPIILADNFNEDEMFNFPEDNLDGYTANYFMPINNSVYGDFSFNGGWENGGCSINDGAIYCDTGYFYNLTSLNVTKANLTVHDDMYITGKLGIGTSSPTSELTVYGTSDIGDSVGNMIRINHAGAGNYGSIQSFVSGGYSDLTLNPNGGNVGIGTSTPQNTLNVVGDGNFTTGLIIGSPTNSVNITMYSPDGTSYSCGVQDGGAFACI